jgi:hypothetical protein
VYVLKVAPEPPETFVQPDVPLALCCHWYVYGGVPPLAVTDMVATPPLQIVTFAGAVTATSLFFTITTWSEEVQAALVAISHLNL